MVYNWSVLLSMYWLDYACWCNDHTGEMSHHEVLDAVAMGTNVILSDHSNSERGFLAVFREKLAVRLPDSVTVAVSKTDRDPLEVVWPTGSYTCCLSDTCSLFWSDKIKDITKSPSQAARFQKLKTIIVTDIAIWLTILDNSNSILLW